MRPYREAVLIIAVFAGACSTPVAETDEFQALETANAQLEERLADSEADLARAADDLAALDAELQSKLTDAEEALAQAQSELDATEDALAEAMLTIEDIETAQAAPPEDLVSVFDLDVGDCFDDPTAFGNVEQVEVVDCANPHDNEVFFEFELPEGDLPTETQIDDTSFDRCVPAFEVYVGATYAESVLDVTYLSPTAESWRAGDRVVTCLLYHVNFDKLTGSMENSGV